MEEEIRAYDVDGGTRALRTAERHGRRDVEAIKALNNLQVLERSPALVLNSDYQPLSYTPLSVWSWQEAVKAVFVGKVDVVAEYAERRVRSANLEMAVPSVIALRGYQPRNLNSRPHFTRRNVYIRDLFHCQYCKDQFRPAQLTFDHVVPKSKNGTTSWNNVVTCCTTCNNRKGDLSAQAFAKKFNVKLKKAPFVPTHEELTAKARRLPLYRRYHETWGAYVSDDSTTTKTAAKGKNKAQSPKAMPPL